MASKSQRLRPASGALGVSDEIQRQVQESVRNLQYKILDAELDIALTFCRVALSAVNRETSERNFVLATNALETARLLLRETNLTIDERAVIQERLEQVDVLTKHLEYRTGQTDGDEHTSTPPRANLTSRTKIVSRRRRSY